MTLGIFITSYNRCYDLLHTCRQIDTLIPKADDVTICLDGCTDDNAGALAAEFPHFHLVRNIIRLGSVPSRDRGFRMSTCDIIVSLDDDSYPLERDFVARVIQTFEERPEAAVITFAELRDKDERFGPFPESSSKARYVAAFANCAAAYRRSLYGVVAGFNPIFGHMYEEPDYALQCYAAGWAVWYEPSIRVRHHVTPNQRSLQRRHELNARNEFLSVVLRCPMPYALLVAMYRVVRQFIYAFGRGPSWFVKQPIWLGQALTRMIPCLRQRRPIAWHSYYAWVRLARHPVSDAFELCQTFRQPAFIEAGIGSSPQKLV